MNASAAVVFKVKDGYAKDAAAALQTSYEQALSYARMYNMDLQKVLQARLFVNGNYVALLVLGAAADDEAAKVDAAWSNIFSSADNSIVITEDSGEDDEHTNGFIVIED